MTWPINNKSRLGGAVIVQSMTEPIGPPAPLRGWDDVWRQVAAVALRTGTGERSLIVLEGHSGVGKSRLLRELVDAAHASGCVTVDGHRWRPPNVAAPLPPSPPLDVRPDTGLALVAWDDDATLDPGFVQMWARTAMLPVVVVVARRTGSRTPLPFVPDSGSTVHIALSPLSRAAVAELVADLLAVPATAELLDLVGAAGGNPRAVVDLVRGLRAEGLVDLASGAARLVRAELQMPTRHRIAEQLAQASPTARHLVQVAATTRGASTLTELAGLMRRGPASLVPAVEEALATGLLVGRGERLAFPHELVRRQVAQSLPPSVRGTLCPDVRPPGSTVTPRRESTVDTEAPRLVPGWNRLTGRQREIAALAGEALTNQEIADRLYLSPHTVNFHLRHIFKQLGISSRVQLVRLAQG
jgi:DNA-binding CsgD family transcriptional regulator